MSRKKETFAEESKPVSAARQVDSEAGSLFDHQTQHQFPIVGIGASAGGLSAFEAFFSGMPVDIEPGMAFVLVQHLAPDHKSILTGLIQRYTRMRVFEVEDGMVVQPNCAYIIPPNRDMAFLNGSLHLMEPSAPRGQRLPIDFFFRSLAQDQHERAICIVLSGTGSDGTLGVRAIKGEGGMVMVQTPDSTEYDGMPRSAIATGLADYQLIPSEMPAQLMAYVAHAFSKPSQQSATPTVKTENAMKKIFILLRTQTGHDFSLYKVSTIRRRIERRMAVHQIETIDAYVKYLQLTPVEVDALFRDLLIGVTSFFRDPDAFKALEDRIIPKLFADKSNGKTIRVWTPGCSTGEEAYSIAILLHERLEALKQGFRLQVFATDIDSQAIATARTGLYPASIAMDISQERLTRFFSITPDGSEYRIHKSIRDMLVFSEQDVVKDPPFSRLDLISCRNLMIYMGGPLQKKLIPLFHYALNPGGFLFLGNSETIGDLTVLFEVIDRKLKFFRRKDDFHNRQPGTSTHFPPSMPSRGNQPPWTAEKTAVSPRAPLREVTEQAILQHFTPPSVLVDKKGDIFYIHGRTGMYLEPCSGETGTNNILKMAREGLKHDLTVALHNAVRTKKTVRHANLQIKSNGGFIPVDLIIQPVPLTHPQASETLLYLVILQELPQRDPRSALSASSCDPDHSQTLTSDQIEALKHELQVKEDYLQTTNEELETSNEELKSSNEEMQSVNEELQSTNEELETSKEELQSVNEELATVNAELQTKLADLSRSNNDMNNLLAGTGIGTIFVDYQLRILRFTPASTQIINLINSDIGRPVGHVVSNLVGYNNLISDMQTVLDSLIPKEVVVQTTAGKWYTMRIQPYRTLANVIEGAVITFVDISQAKKAEETLRIFQAKIKDTLKTTQILLFTQDIHLRYNWIYSANPQFSQDRLIGKTDEDFLKTDEAAILTKIKRRVLETGLGKQQKVRITINGKIQYYILTVEPIFHISGEIEGIICALLFLISDSPEMQQNKKESQPKRNPDE